MFYDGITGVVADLSIGEADDSVLLWGVDARRHKQGGQVKDVDIQSEMSVVPHGRTKSMDTAATRIQ